MIFKNFVSVLNLFFYFSENIIGIFYITFSLAKKSFINNKFTKIMSKFRTFT